MAQSQLGQRPRLLLQGRSSPLRLSPFEIITLLVVLALTAYIGYTPVSYTHLTLPTKA